MAILVSSEDTKALISNIKFVLNLDGTLNLQVTAGKNIRREL
jgi:hypothetical protein